MDTKKLLKLLNINILELSTDLEIPALEKLINNVIYAVKHPNGVVKKIFYEYQWESLENIENAIEHATKACSVIRKVLQTLDPKYAKNKAKEDTSRIILGTGYPWLDSLAQDDNIQRISLYSKKYGDGKLVNLKVGDATSSKKYRLVLEKL